MRVRHTRCPLNGCFGLFKKSFRSNEVESMKDCEAMINLSCDAYDALRMCWPWLEWGVFLVKFNSQLKALHGYQHFSVSRENPITVMLKRRCDRVADSLRLLKPGVPVKDIINAGRLVIVTPSGSQRIGCSTSSRRKSSIFGLTRSFRGRNKD